MMRPSANGEHVHAVVVGSGFGGSVTAQRLADAGWDVVVLERGKAYPPGGFPRTPFETRNNFWDPSEGHYGLFDVWSFSDLDAVISSGLGGGSLIYANVLLRKDEKWFVKDDRTGGAYESWPVTRKDLDPHYNHVESVLTPQRYPFDHAPYSLTPKTVAYKQAAEARNLDWCLPPLAVTFANPGEPASTGQPIHEAIGNIHGRPRETCRLCGECDIGCNFGSKNTLDLTYLSAAWHAGADIRTGCEVHSFRPRDGGGWEVGYRVHPLDGSGAGATQRVITCDHLVLSAGTFGTTFLLLRNRSTLPGLSGCIGEGFSGNGDLLTFAVQCRETGADGKRSSRRVDASIGPVITSAIRVGDAVDGGGATGRGFYLEDAGYPLFASWLMQLVDEPHALLRAAPVIASIARHLIEHRGEELDASARRLFGECDLATGMLPLLGMGRDVPDGRMGLNGDLLDVHWRKDGGSREYFDRLRRVSEDIADSLGGSFLDNPIWTLNRVVTVHALGGSRMGESDQTGVVDSWGNVFNLPGLHVADGSVMPGPVGPNPSMTIAALADRFAEGMIDGRVSPPPGAPVRPPAAEGEPTAPPPSTATGTTLSFRERMVGYLGFGSGDYEDANRDGKEKHQSLAFELTIMTRDADRFIAEPDHEASALGFVVCPALGGRLKTTSGWFNLFVDLDGDKPRKRMFYRLWFADGEGNPLTLVGYKEIRDDRGFDLWSDTTTLFYRVRSGHVDVEHEAASDVVGSGILRIRVPDFARQMTTFRVDPAKDVDALGKFGLLFAGELWQVYRPGA
jgi:cholesterol oxidase